MSAKQPPLGPTVIGSKAPVLVALIHLCDPGAINQLSSDVDNGCHLRCSTEHLQHSFIILMAPLRGILLNPKVRQHGSLLSPYF